MPVQPPAELVERLRGEIGELPGARIARIAETLSFYDADVLVTGGLDRLWAAVVDGGRRRRKRPRTSSRTSSSPRASTRARSIARELAKLVAARAEIPRAAFDEALAKAGDAGFNADPYLEQKVVADAAELDPIIERSSPRTRARRSSTAAARRACSASSSAR